MSEISEDVCGRVGNSESVYTLFGVRPVVNCCGIYTDLGGSVLSASVWRAAEELNHSYIKMTELLNAAGVMIASLVNAESCRVTPGASAAIALAVAATMTGRNGKHWEQLPNTRGLKDKVVIARSHSRQYKYGSCVRMPGARLVESGPSEHFDLDALIAAVRADTACVFVPAHLLDGFSGVAQLTALVERVHKIGVPVVVDAAYLSYPVDLLRQLSGSGADLICFSAKYFFGPNSGGFVCGKRALVDIVAGLDFTCFESGQFRTFGRPFKMSRYDVATTALALREWVALDHTKRWRDYASKVSRIAESLPRRDGFQARPCLFTMSEDLVEGATVNCLAVTFDAESNHTAASVAARLEADNPIVAAMVKDEVLIIAVDALLDGQEQTVADRLARAISE